MREPAFSLRSFWALGLAGAFQLVVALALLAALLAIGQKRLVDFIVILPIIAMLLVTAGGSLVLASHIWAALGRRLAAPRLPGFVEAAMKRLASLSGASEPQPQGDGA